MQFNNGTHVRWPLINTSSSQWAFEIGKKQIWKNLFKDSSVRFIRFKIKHILTENSLKKFLFPLLQSLKAFYMYKAWQMITIIKVVHLKKDLMNNISCSHSGNLKYYTSPNTFFDLNVAASITYLLPTKILNNMEQCEIYMWWWCEILLISEKLLQYISTCTSNFLLNENFCINGTPIHES